MRVKALSFQIVHFKAPDSVTKEPREVILVYALGEDGIIYEFNGSWMALPIEQENLREFSVPPVNRPKSRRT